MKFTERYDSLFRWYAEQSGCDWQLLKALAICESGLDPDIPGPTKDLGLLQFTDETWAWIIKSWETLTKKGTLKLIDRRDPEDAIRAGAAMLGWLLRECGGKSHLALAAYNHGIGNIKRKFLAPGLDYDPAQVPEITRKHVQRIMETYAAVKMEGDANG